MAHAMLVTLIIGDNLCTIFVRLGNRQQQQQKNAQVPVLQCSGGVQIHIHINNSQGQGIIVHEVACSFKNALCASAL